MSGNLIFLLWQLYNKSASTIFAVFWFLHLLLGLQTLLLLLHKSTVLSGLLRYLNSCRQTFSLSADAYASPWFHPSWMIFPQAIQDHFPKLLLISGAATAESSVTVSGSAFTFKFFFGYKSLLLPKKVQKRPSTVLQ